MTLDSPQRTEPDTASPTPLVVYLAEPPEGGALAETWGEIATFHLTSGGFHVYRPVAAWRYAEVPEDRRATSINRHALSQADALVAILPSAHQAGLAVPMEIEAALALAIPVVVVTQAHSPLADRPGVTVTDRPEGVAGAVLAALEAAPPVNRAASGPLGHIEGNYYRPPAPRVAGRLQVRAKESTLVPSGATVTVPTDRQLGGVGWGMVVGRALGERSLTVHTQSTTGPGPVYVRVHNFGREAQSVMAGEWFADLLIYSS